MKVYQVQATVNRYDGPNQGHTVVQIPTFYLRADVQGITRAEHAQQIAERMLLSLAPQYSTAHASVSEVDDPIAGIRAVLDSPNCSRPTARAFARPARLDSYLAILKAGRVYEVIARHKQGAEPPTTIALNLDRETADRIAAERNGHAHFNYRYYVERMGGR